MQLKLSLQTANLNAGSLQDLTRELGETINRATEIRAEIPESSPREGDKGDAVSLGTLVLTFMSSGAAVALFEVAKAYFERNKSLVLKFEREDGRTFELNAENLSRGQVEESLVLARSFVEGGP